jgi:hypothetical protein
MLSRKQIHELVDLVLDVQEKTTNHVIIEIKCGVCPVQIRTMNGPFHMEKDYTYFYFFCTYDDQEAQETFEQCISHLKQLEKKNPREAATPQGK